MVKYIKRHNLKRKLIKEMKKEGVPASVTKAALKIALKHTSK